MIMKKLVCLSLLLCSLLMSVSHLFAQESTTPAKKKKVIIKIDPLKILSPKYPVVQIGAEYLFYNRWSVEQSFGVNRGWFSSFSALDHQVFTSRTELRCYLSKRQNRRMNGTYAALEFMYGNNQYDYEAWFAREGTYPAEILCIEQIDIHRNTLRTNLKFGVQAVTRSGFTLDFFAGPGFNHEKVKHKNRFCEPSAVLYLNGNGGTISFIDHNEDAQLLPNLAMGFKVGWAF